MPNFNGTGPQGKGPLQEGEEDDAGIMKPNHLKTNLLRMKKLFMDLVSDENPVIAIAVEVGVAETKGREEVSEKNKYLIT
jgi:hypothetical protein